MEWFLRSGNPNAATGATMLNAITSPAGLLAATASFVTALALCIGVKTLRRLAVCGFGIVLMSSALVAGAYSLHAAALTHFGLITRAPAAAFGIRLPPAAAYSAPKREAQAKPLTDLNQALAHQPGIFMTEPFAQRRISITK